MTAQTKQTYSCQGTVIAYISNEILVVTIAEVLPAGVTACVNVSTIYGSAQADVMYLDRLANIAVLKAGINVDWAGFRRIRLESRHYETGDELTGARFDELGEHHEIRTSVFLPSYMFKESGSEGEYIIAKILSPCGQHDGRKLLAGMGMHNNGILAGMFEAFCKSNEELLCIRIIPPQVVCRIGRYIQEFSGGW